MILNFIVYNNIYIIKIKIHPYFYRDTYNNTLIINLFQNNNI